MAERRMFAKSVVLSGRFMKLPLVTQLLYFRLGMEADDDGFHNAPDFAVRNCGATRKDLERLEAQGYIHCFENDVVVLMHWRVHNLIRRDRYRQTMYTEELGQLAVGENGEYVLVNQRLTQDRIGKDRIGQVSLGQDITPAAQAGSRSVGEDPPRLAEILCYALESGIHTDTAAFLNHYADLGWPGRSRYTWKTLLRQWEEEHAGTP